MWIAVYALMVVVGIETGKMAWAIPVARQPLLAHLYYPLMYLFALPAGAGLLGLLARLDGRARILGSIGAVFAMVALLLGLINALLLPISAVSQQTGLLHVAMAVSTAFPGYIAALFGSGFMGWAALRARALPRSIAWTLIVVAIATVPVLFTTPLPVGPDWASDALAFLLSGFAFVTVGVRLRESPASVANSQQRYVAPATAPSR
jgi:hypothetical protein